MWTLSMDARVKYLIKDEIIDAYAKGEINELQYKFLTEKISKISGDTQK